MYIQKVLLKGAAALAVVALIVPAANGAIVINGDLNEWGFSVADNNGSTWGVPYTFGTNISGSKTVSGYKIFYNIEDTNDNSNSYYVGPNSGGQDYDAELLAAIYTTTSLHIAVVSGQRPDNGSTRFAPGDIRIQNQTGNVFGIEVGGSFDSLGNDLAGAAALENYVGATYTLNSSGYTQSSATSGTVGEILDTDAWIMDPINPPSPTQIDHSGSSSSIGLADYIYTANTATSQHSIIELTISKAELDKMGKIATIEWRPSCGNDELLLDVSTFTPQQNPVPEPSTLAIWGLGGLIGLIAAYRKRRKS